MNNEGITLLNISFPEKNKKIKLCNLKYPDINYIQIQFKWQKWYNKNTYFSTEKS